MLPRDVSRVMFPARPVIMLACYYHDAKTSGMGTRFQHDAALLHHDGP